MTLYTFQYHIVVSGLSCGNNIFGVTLSCNAEMTISIKPTIPTWTLLVLVQLPLFVYTCIVPQG